MKVFTYNDYIKVIHAVRRSSFAELREEPKMKYGVDEIKSDANNKPDDKLINKILNSKREVVGVINNFLSPVKLFYEKDIDKWNNSYIMRKYKDNDMSLVYRTKNSKMFFLIIHKSTIDYNISYRILEYCIDIIHEWKREQKRKKINIYPVIVPIVIYTGKEKWKVLTDYKDLQFKTTSFENCRINLSYNLIDVNKISKESLLKNKLLKMSN